METSRYNCHTSSESSILWYKLYMYLLMQVCQFRNILIHFTVNIIGQLLHRSPNYGDFSRMIPNHTSYMFNIDWLTILILYQKVILILFRVAYALVLLWFFVWSGFPFERMWSCSSIRSLCLMIDEWKHTLYGQMSTELSFEIKLDFTML